MGLGKVNSFYSACCAVGAALSVVAAGQSFRDGETLPDVEPYVTAPFRLLNYVNPFKGPPPAAPSYVGRSMFELTESEAMLVMLYFAAVGAVSAMVFAWKARRRREPSQLWAFPAILSMLVVLQLAQLLQWIAPRWGY